MPVFMMFVAAAVIILTVMIFVGTIGLGHKRSEDTEAPLVYGGMNFDQRREPAAPSTYVLDGATRRPWRPPGRWDNPARG